MIIKDKTQINVLNGYVKGGEGGRDGDRESVTEIGKDKTLPGVNETWNSGNKDNGGISKT